MSLWASKPSPDIVRRYAKRVLGRTVSPHVWRHTFATHLVSNGANIVYVQRLLGHTSLKTTEIYTRVSVPDLRRRWHAPIHARAQGHGPGPGAHARSGGADAMQP